MINTLFNPNGRISSGEFIKGAVVLIVIGALVQLMPLYAPEAITKYLGTVIGLLLIYPWICLFMKRFRDGGKPGAMCLIPFGIYAVLSMGLSMGLMFTNPAMGEIMQAAMEGADKADTDAMTADLGRSMATKLTIAMAILSSIIAFGTNALIKGDPADNQYGPAS